MKKSLVLVLLFVMLVSDVSGCGFVFLEGSNKQPSEAETEPETSKDEGGLLLGLITEVEEESYKVKLMGHYTNNIEMYIMVGRKFGEFVIGDDVMITIEGKLYLEDGNGNKVEYDNTSQWVGYLEDKTEVLLQGEVLQIVDCKNDGIFTGTVVAIEDLYNADMEPIGAQFCIKPLEGEGEAGSFSFANLNLGYGFDLNANVEVTYDPETLEIISITEK